jgi:hypothetical protein
LPPRSAPGRAGRHRLSSGPRGRAGDWQGARTILQATSEAADRTDAQLLYAGCCSAEPAGQARRLQPLLTRDPGDIACAALAQAALALAIRPGRSALRPLAAADFGQRVAPAGERPGRPTIGTKFAQRQISDPQELAKTLADADVR